MTVVMEREEKTVSLAKMGFNQLLAGEYIDKMVQERE